MKRKILLLSLMLLIAAFIWNRQSHVQAPANSTPTLLPVEAGTLIKPVASSAPTAVPTAPPNDATATVTPSQAVISPIITFRTWAVGYLATPQDQRAAMLPQGIKLAEAHTREIATMIPNDPQQALENAVPMVIRQDLPLSIVGRLEKRVSMKASLNVYGNVPLPEAEGAPDFKPYTRSVTKKDGSYWNAYTYGARASQRSMSLASINGISVGNDMAVAEAPARQLETGERPMVTDREVVEICPVSEKITAVKRAATGLLPPISEETPALETEEKIIYVCSGGHIAQVFKSLTVEEEQAHWETMGAYLNAGAGSGAGTAPIGTIPTTFTTGHRTLLYIRATFSDQRTDPQSEAECMESLRLMAEYISQTSYGRCYFTYVVTPLIVLPYPESWYLESPSGDHLLANQARTLAKKMGYDPLAYNFDVARWNGGPGIYSGSASIGGRSMNLKTNSVGTFCHELGHNLGLWHSNYWLTTPPSSIGPGKNAEYGNIFDLMGKSSRKGQYTAHFKNILNWLPTETYWSVTQSGTYRLHQFDYAAADPSFHYALRIKKDAERDYWAEFRQRFTANTGLMNGLMMTWNGWGQGNIGGSGGSPPNGSNGGAQLLDMTPGSFGNGISDTREDSALWVGRTFSDDDAEIHITPISKNTNTTPPSMDVYVSLGAVPGNLPPTLSITASTTTPAVLAALTLTAIATDPNADPLAYAWVFGDGTYSTNNSPSQTKSWPTAGHYQVLCTASDMKGKRTTHSILVTVGTPTTFTVSGKITGIDSQPLEGVYVSNYIPSNLTGHPDSSTFSGTWTDSDGNYTLTELETGNYTLSSTLYPYLFTPSSFANPLSVGPSSTGKNFTSSSLPSLTISVTDPIANEAATPGTGTVRLARTGSTTSALEVQIFKASTGTATRDSDYVLSPLPTAAKNEGGSGASLYTIPAGSAFLDITITPRNDNAKEGTEYAVLNFANTSGGYILAGSAVAIIDILDDDSPALPEVKLTCLDKVASEDSSDSATLQMTRNGPTTSSLTVNLTLTGTATNVTDYSVPTSVVIPAGSASTIFTLTTVDDTIQEETETVILTLATRTAYALDALSQTQTIILHDNDQPTVSLIATDATATETPGNSGIFTFTRAGGNFYQALTVDYALSGRAVHGVDYRRLDGRAIIPAGASSTTVEIQPFDDSLSEDIQDVILQLRSSTTYHIKDRGIATLSITDNDGPQVDLRLVTSGKTEPTTGSSTAITFQITRPVSGTEMTVKYAVSGTAISGLDFTALPGTITFTPVDTTKTLTIFALADAELEDAETVIITLLPGSGYTLMPRQAQHATGFILDEDQPTVDVTAADTLKGLITQGTESSPDLRFFVTRKVATPSDLTVNYTLSGTATAGKDYTGTIGSVTIPADQSGAFVTLVPVDDSLPEGVESIIMDITPAPGSYGVHIPSATILLGDNDAFSSGTVGFAADTSTTTESSGTYNIPVTITGSPHGTVTVNYRVNAGTATGSGDDYTLPEGILTFLPGTTTLNIPVAISQDLLPEPAETIALQLYNPTGGNLGTASHILTISNQSLPEAFTDATSNLLASSVTLNGQALPNGIATDVFFQYGPTLAYGGSTNLQAIGSGTSSITVTALLTGFSPRGYHARLVARNSAGTTYGIDQIISSNNADLASLTPSIGTLSPDFSPATKDYLITVSNTTASIFITPTLAQADATVTVNGTIVTSATPSTAIPLTFGTTPVTLLVTAQDGYTTKSYTLIITRGTLSFSQWQVSFFGRTDLPSAAPTADPDADGIVNLLEYYLGGLPTGATASNTSILPTSTLSATAMTYSFRRSKSASLDLLTTIETTTTFTPNSWTSVAATNIAVQSIDLLTELVTTTIPLVPGSERLFVRLRVESKPPSVF